jgi:hypothetical protein
MSYKIHFPHLLSGSLEFFEIERGLLFCFDVSKIRPVGLILAKYNICGLCTSVSMVMLILPSASLEPSIFAELFGNIRCFLIRDWRISLSSTTTLKPVSPIFISITLSCPRVGLQLISSLGYYSMTSLPTHFTPLNLIIEAPNSVGFFQLVLLLFLRLLTA